MQAAFLPPPAYAVSIPGSTWTQHVLHQFTAAADGSFPWGTLLFGPDGSLYGTTSSGGTYCCNGNVFQMTPESNGTWKLHVLHEFNGKDGQSPFGGVIFDATGNLYGMTALGGNNNACIYGSCGLAFKLTPTADRWVESVLWVFANNPNALPDAGLVLDNAGNLYGTTSGLYYGTGTVIEITPRLRGVQ